MLTLMVVKVVMMIMVKVTIIKSDDVLYNDNETDNGIFTPKPADPRR